MQLSIPEIVEYSIFHFLLGATPHQPVYARRPIHSVNEFLSIPYVGLMCSEALRMSFRLTSATYDVKTEGQAGIPGTHGRLDRQPVRLAKVNWNVPTFSPTIRGYWAAASGNFSVSSRRCLSAGWADHDVVRR
jgi:hypothetical protein